MIRTGMLLDCPYNAVGNYIFAATGTAGFPFDSDQSVPSPRTVIDFEDILRTKISGLSLGFELHWP